MAYSKEYWDYQKEIGNKPYHTKYVSQKFNSFINKSDDVLDFGCGGLCFKFNYLQKKNWYRN